ncbi:Lacal_2735 family protein [Tenacibaculum maritimum]|uniref:Lacal_2735 family protein n=1 Tax=Tenacibaculum maritimum NCIMB 2154 TaxID=1349785 RepID=A0A2H1ECB8_9FLAO|nr:Lacal_2735 family protein [Tenacibaculum maritimum]MCD9562939.1 Lacal_2735 family protein [Tenacibaculum maritimum]MCD9565500.1 Lacal_2735 family protein [Tenacibaculum maritimum]MCD9578042.1 Lacal_2735 family protein [Tenacibaculum maritimum]MCD9585206.1 Lacal_2735 family protein [Tenacibaculum maritimum]MCD9595984.1 Lacal_2735 family protein [Tenacibaculum maritimum]
MPRLNQLQVYKQSLEEKYSRLIEKANAYRYIDECKSDRSAYKATRVLEKLDRLRYLNDNMSNLTM